jgi:regulator of sigma E protease
MAGDTPDDATAHEVTGAPDEFLSKPKWQRFLILFAGPAMNIAIAIIFIAGIAMIPTEYPVIKNIVGEVKPNQAGAKAGLQPGDRIVRIGNESINDFEDLRLAITMNAGTALPVEYIRNGERRTTTITPDRENSDYGPVGRAGIVPWIDPTVGRVVAGSPADKAGLKVGDRIVSANGTPVDDLADIDAILKKNRDAALTLAVLRGASTVQIQLPAVKYNARDPYRGFLPPLETRRLTIGAAFKESVQQNWKMLRYALNAIKRMFRAEGSVRELSGPIDIARISGDMLRRGWVEVIALMAMISLQLGVMNLLPIPVLDGGHIAILLVEGVSRRELSLRAKERVQQLGFAMLAALMLVVIFNDVLKNVARLGQG